MNSPAIARAANDLHGTGGLFSKRNQEKKYGGYYEIKKVSEEKEKHGPLVVTRLGLGERFPSRRTSM
jgi:hypothetical protein